MALDQAQALARPRRRFRREEGRAASPRPRRSTTVVEFIGIPGSGKTTLCTAIVADLRRDGLEVITEHDYFRWMKRSPYRKVGSVITHGPRTWYFALHLSWFLYRCTLLRGWALGGMVFHLTCMRVWLAQTVTRAAPGVVLLDGFAWFRLTNRLRDYAATGLGTPRQLERILELFYPRCDLRWIFKTIPVEVAVERISRRMLRDRAPRGIETSSPERRHVVLSRQTHLYQRVFDAVRSLYGDRVYWVDGAEPLAQQVARIKTTITRSLRQESLAAAVPDSMPPALSRGEGRICEY